MREGPASAPGPLRPWVTLSERLGLWGIRGAGARRCRTEGALWREHGSLWTSCCSTEPQLGCSGGPSSPWLQAAGALSRVAGSGQAGEACACFLASGEQTSRSWPLGAAGVPGCPS